MPRSGVTVPRCVVYYNYDGHWWLLCQGLSCITAVIVTGDYCAKVCRVLQLCSSLVITVPRSVVYYSCVRHW